MPWPTTVGGDVDVDVAPLGVGSTCEMHRQPACAQRQRQRTTRRPTRCLRAEADDKAADGRARQVVDCAPTSVESDIERRTNATQLAPWRVRSGRNHCALLCDSKSTIGAGSSIVASAAPASRALSTDIERLIAAGDDAAIIAAVAARGETGVAVVAVVPRGEMGVVVVVVPRGEMGIVAVVVPRDTGVVVGVAESETTIVGNKTPTPADCGTCAYCVARDSKRRDDVDNASADLRSGRRLRAAISDRRTGLRTRRTAIGAPGCASMANN